MTRTLWTIDYRPTTGETERVGTYLSLRQASAMLRMDAAEAAIQRGFMIAPEDMQHQSVMRLIRPQDLNQPAGERESVGVVSIGCVAR